MGRLKGKTYQLQVSWHSLWKLLSDRESEFQDLYEKKNNGKDLKVIRNTPQSGKTLRVVLCISTSAKKNIKSGNILQSPHAC